MKKEISDRTIGRLGQYRRLLARLVEQGRDYIFSHDLATLVHGTAAQVRRDLMVLGARGNPARGYSVAGLLSNIEAFLDHPEGQNVALVGVGKIGRALLAFFTGQPTKLRFVAAFDSHPDLAGRVLHGCPCYPVDALAERVRADQVTVGVIAVPAEAAQEIADRLIEAGVGGLLNFAPVRLKTPAHVYVEYIDVTVSLERVAYMARHHQGPDELS